MVYFKDILKHITIDQRFLSNKIGRVYYCIGNCSLNIPGKDKVTISVKIQ